MPEGMDFHLVTSTLLKDFEEKGVRYAVIGGFAMGLWGASRATVDMDFLLLLDDLAQAESVLADLSYRCVYRSENVAQYVSDLAPFGQVDVVLAFRAISRAMLERSARRELEQGRVVRTLIPEDLAGLKLQAMVNDPSRETQERAVSKS